MKKMSGIPCCGFVSWFDRLFPSRNSYTFFEGGSRSYKSRNRFSRAGAGVVRVGVRVAKAGTDFSRAGTDFLRVDFLRAEQIFQEQDQIFQRQDQIFREQEQELRVASKGSWPSPSFCS